MRMKVTVDPDRRGYTNATFSAVAENGRAVARFEETGAETCRINLRFFISEGTGFPVEAAGAFYRDFEWMGVQRQLKVLGIFARLFYRDGKDGYLKDMPGANYQTARQAAKLAADRATFARRRG